MKNVNHACTSGDKLQILREYRGFVATSPAAHIGRFPWMQVFGGLPSWCSRRTPPLRSETKWREPRPSQDNLPFDSEGLLAA